MAIYFDARGNLGTEPELKLFSVDGVEKARVGLRVYFGNAVQNEQGKWEDKGGCWFTVYLWGKPGEDANRLLHKGVRVRVEGKLLLETWTDPATDQEKSRYVVQARHVDLDLGHIDSVIFKPKADSDSPAPRVDDNPISPPAETNKQRRSSKREPAEAPASA